MSILPHPALARPGAGTRSRRMGSRRGPTSLRRWLPLLPWAMAVLVYAAFLAILHYALTIELPQASPMRLASFRAVEPFQHRILLPFLAHLAAPWLDVGVTVAFLLLDGLAWSALILVAYAGLTLFAVGRSRMVRALLAFTVIVPVFLHVAVPHVELRTAPWVLQIVPLYYYPYDLPSAAFTLGLIGLTYAYHRRPTTARLATYLFIFALATFNRETTVFLIPFFALALWPRLPRGRWMAAVGAQVILLAAIQYGLQSALAHQVNPKANITGSNYEMRLYDNLAVLGQPLNLLSFVARLGAGLYVPLFLFRRHLHPFLRTALLAFGIPFTTAGLVFGRVQEYRILVEALPLLWLGAVQAMHAWTRSLPGQEGPPPDGRMPRPVWQPGQPRVAPGGGAMSNQGDNRPE